MRIKIKTFMIIVLLSFIINISLLAQTYGGNDNSQTNIYGQNPAATRKPSEEKIEVPEERTSEKKILIPGFNLGIIAGIDVFDFITEKNTNEVYQIIGIKPTFEKDTFRISLNLQFHFRLTNEDDSFIEIFKEEWIPDIDKDQNFLDVYLPKIDFIKWGKKEEAFFMSVDQMFETTLGTGFLINNYSNTLFQAHEQIVGLNLNLDGQIFDFPYWGIESMVGNLARFDVLAARLYFRPFYSSGIPILKDFEIAASIAADSTPDLRPEYYTTELNNGSDANMVTMYNGDVVIPLLNKNFLSLGISGNFCYQNTHIGGDVEIGGRFFSIIPFSFKFYIFEDNFIPSYFDYSYDINRGQKYDIYNLTDGTVMVEEGQSWMASTGLLLFGDKLGFRLALDGPVSALPSEYEVNNSVNSYLDFLHMHLYLDIAEGLIPNITTILRYDKLYINSVEDFSTIANSTLDLIFCYSTDFADVSLEYKWLYSEDEEKELNRNDFDITTSIFCTFKLF